MTKQAEKDYLKNIGEAGIEHAFNKPFSDPQCGLYFAQLGAVLTLLPDPPARLLDMGCGTGWTSWIFAKRGYDVTGVDISEDMVHYARLNAERYGLENARFIAGDYEDTELGSGFDCAVFYDSLHHALDTESALRMVYRSLSRTASASPRSRAWATRGRARQRRTITESLSSRPLRARSCGSGRSSAFGRSRCIRTPSSSTPRCTGAQGASSSRSSDG